MIEQFEVGQRLDHKDLGLCVVVDVCQGGMVSLIEMNCRKRLDVDASWLMSTCRLVAPAPKTGDLWRWKAFVGRDLQVYKIVDHEGSMNVETWLGGWRRNYHSYIFGIVNIAIWFAARGCVLAEDGFSAEEPANTKPKFDGVWFHHHSRPSRVYALVAQRDHYSADLVVDDGNGGTWVDGYREDEIEAFFAEGRWVRAVTPEASAA